MKREDSNPEQNQQRTVAEIDAEIVDLIDQRVRSTSIESEEVVPNDHDEWDSEEETLRRVKSLSDDTHLDTNVIKAIFRLIIHESRNQHR